MKLHLTVLALSLTLVYPYDRKPQCHACFDGICYSRSTIFQDYSVIGHIAVERGGNVVHFHYKDTKTSKDYTKAFDLDDIRLLNVPDIEYSFARTVDQATRDVYIGGTKGIFKYSPITNKTTQFGLADKIIWHMQYNRKLYYTEFSETTGFVVKGLFTYSNKKSTSVLGLSEYSIEDFVIDKRDDIYFMSNRMMYRLKSGEKKPTVFSNTVYSLVTDIYDNVYFIQSSSRALYKVNYRKGNLIEVGAFADGSPMKAVFDNYNNVIYYDSDSRKLLYLTPNYGICKVKSEGVGAKMKKTVTSVTDNPMVIVFDDSTKANV